MVDLDSLQRAFTENEGILRSSQLAKLGLHSRELAKLVNGGTVMKLKRGTYEWVSESVLSDLEVLPRLIPDGVICLESAVYCHGYSDRVPAEWDIAVDKDSNKKRYRLNYPALHIHYVEAHLLSIGVTQIDFDGHPVSIYDKDRTVCDVLRYARKLDPEVVNKALTGYVRDPDKNIRHLMEYSKALRVYKRVREVIGIWL